MHSVTINGIEHTMLVHIQVSDFSADGNENASDATASAGGGMTAE